MDFHSLARKELQALCKKNKIPANLTNVAMADALKALEKVEGLDELGNAQKSSAIKPEPQTTARTSTRKKQVNVEPESSHLLSRTRRTTRRTIAEEGEDEIKHVIFQGTPAPTNQRRGPAASTRRKIDTQLMECGEDQKQDVQEQVDLPKNSAVCSSRRKVETQKDEKSDQKAYSTRHSVRLLEKTMGDLGLKEERKIEAVKFEGLCEETEEVEQLKDLPGESLKNEGENYEAVEDNKTNEQEVDKLSEKECEMEHKFNENNKIDESEVHSDENQFLGSENERNIKMETETCADSDNLSGFEAVDQDDNGNTHIQSENSDKEIDMIHESIDLKGSDAQKTENPDKTMNSDLIGNQYESNTFHAMKSEEKPIAEGPDEIANPVNSWTAEELSEGEKNKISETNADNARKNCNVFEDEFGSELDETDSLQQKSPSMDVVSSPFAGNTIQGQFPRPTSAPKKLPTIHIDTNKENANNGRDADRKESLNEMSLRQLTKAVKEKLQIKNNAVPMVGGTRMALEKLPENNGVTEPNNN